MEEQFDFDPVSVSEYLEETYGDEIHVISIDGAETFVEIPHDLTEEIAEDLLCKGVMAVDVVDLPDHELSEDCVVIDIIS